MLLWPISALVKLVLTTAAFLPFHRLGRLSSEYVFSFYDCSPPWPLRAMKVEVWLNQWAERWRLGGGGGGERLCCLRPLWNSSIMVAQTGNQSTAALSTDAIGPVPATMNGLSAALKDASYSTINFKMSGFPHWTTFWFSGAVRVVATPPCFVSHKRYGWCVCEAPLIFLFIKSG